MNDDLCVGQVWSADRQFYHQESHLDDRWSVWPEDEMQAGETGKEVREVVSIVDLPQPFERRVFFLKRYVAPDGREFGKKGLHCTAQRGFRRWLNNSNQHLDGRPTLIAELEKGQGDG